MLTHWAARYCIDKVQLPSKFQTKKELQPANYSRIVPWQPSSLLAHQQHGYIRILSVDCLFRSRLGPRVQFPSSHTPNHSGLAPILAKSPFCVTLTSPHPEHHYQQTKEKGKANRMLQTLLKNDLNAFPYPLHARTHCRAEGVAQGSGLEASGTYRTQAECKKEITSEHNTTSAVILRWLYSWSNCQIGLDQIPCHERHAWQKRTEDHVRTRPRL